MQLRRLAVAVLAAGIPLIGFAAPAGAATYPPDVPTQQKTVAPGVMYGGSATGATVIDTCSGSMAAQVTAGASVMIKVCGWFPGASVAVSVTPPHGVSTKINTIPADGDGAVTVGPLRLETPGAYHFVFKGPRGSVEGLGVGGVGSRGLSRVAAAPNTAVAVTLTVPADGTLPQTGSDSSGPSTAVWGVGLLLVGALLLLVVRARRRRTPAPAELSAP